MGFGQWRKKEKRSQRSQRKDGGGSRWLPPPAPGNSFDSVPKWERQFCSQMSWRDFCYKKQAIHIYPKVLNWDDSAGKEAFDSAKARYWAKINDLPCKVPLPDPNMYIDEIDDNVYIDPWLIEDLYELPPPPPYQEEIRDLSSITPTGWDVVDPSPSDKIPEFITTKPSTVIDIVNNSVQNFRIAIDDELKNIVPVGWGDAEDTETNKSRDMRESESNGAFSINRESSEVRCRAWQQDRRNDDIVAGEKVSSLEHQDNGYRERAGGGSFGSNYMNQRCNEHGYDMDIWNKYAKEQYFWHQSSLDRGLSCAPQNY